MRAKLPLVFLMSSSDVFKHDKLLIYFQATCFIASRSENPYSICGKFEENNAKTIGRGKAALLSGWSP